MAEKLLDPTSQADWKKFGKQFETDFDAFENEAKIPDHEKRMQNDEVARSKVLSKEEVEVRGFLDDFVGKALRGSGYKENTILATTRKIRTIVIGRLKDEGEIISEENVLKGLQEFAITESTKKAGKKYEAILKVLNNKEKEATAKKSTANANAEIEEEELGLNVRDAVKLKEKELEEIAKQKKAEEDAKLKKEEEARLSAEEAQRVAEELVKQKKEAKETAKKASDAKKDKKNKSTNKKPKSKESEEMDDIANKINHLINEIKVAQGRLKRVKGAEKKTKLEDWILLKEEELARLEFEKNAIKEKYAKEAEKNPETNEAEFKIELTEVEKNEVMEFFDNHVLPLYMGEKQKQGWSEYNNRVEEFLGRKFFEIADALGYFDGYSEKKIAKAWDFVKSGLKAKIEAMEKEAEKRETQKDKEFTLDEVYQKLKSAGADDEDVKYFFNLHKKDRQDFLLSSDEELKLRIEKLREAREMDEKRVSEDEKEEIDRRLGNYGNYMKDMRTSYLKKEYEFNKTSSKMKRMFGKIINLGNSEQELKNSKAEYHEAVENYIKLIVRKEGINDQEEAEIMLNYFSIQEALNLQEEKISIKASSDPKLLQMSEDVLGKVFKGYLNAYKTTSGFLSNKTSELVSKVSDSKVLNFAGKMSGGMAFAVGISNVFQATGAPYWITKSILLATSTGVKTMENKEKMDKELTEKEAKEKESRELLALEEIYAATQLNFKSAVEKVFISEANTSLEYQENKESRNKKMWLKAFGEAVKTNGKWFLIGLGSAELIKGFCDILTDPKNDTVDIANANEAESLKKESALFMPTHPAGTDIHSSFNIPPSNAGVDEANQSMDTIVKREKEIAKTLNEMKNLHKPDVSAQLSADSKPENNISQGAEEKTSHAGAQEISGEDNLEHEYDGIVLNEFEQGDIYVEEGSSMKDTVAKLLIQNHEKLTEGKMGWNPDKYSSVEEWANKRAIGIVGEFTEGSHDYDKISVDSKIMIDLNNPADIRIVDFVDGQDLEAPVKPDNAFGPEDQDNTETPDNEGDEFDNNEENPAEAIGRDTEALINTDTVFGSENQGGDVDNSSDSEDIFENNEEEPAEVAPEKKVISAEIKEPVVSIRESMTGDVIEKDILPEDVVEKDMEEVRKNMGKQEALAAKRIGIDPEHYAKINQMSTAEFIAEAKRVDNIVHGGGEDSMDVVSSSLPLGSAFSDDEVVNIRMGRVLDYLVRDGKIENPNQSIAETLRTVSQQDLMGSIRTYEGIFGSIDDGEGIAMRLNEDEVYSEYMASLIQVELKDMLGSNTDEGKVMRELATLRGVAMRDLADNELLSAFKEATRDVVGNVEYRDNDTVGKYIVRIIRAAHDEGAIGKLRDSLAKIEVAA